MTTVTLTIESIISMTKHIDQTIDNLPIDDKKAILNIIIKSGMNDKNIHAKGNGTQIKYKDMSYETIYHIHNYILDKDKEKIKNLNNFTEENTE